jgi:hypothetical protein
MGQGMIQKLIGVLMNISESLGSKCACAETEKIAVIVHRIMSFQARQFHTLEHVFGFLDGADAITALAAIFHDLIYRQVDGGLPPETAALLAPYMVEKSGKTRLADDIAGKDRPFELCRRIFGFENGRELDPLDGLNEFLSALTLAKLTEGHFPEKAVIGSIVCIEASIPFRGPDAQGRSVGEALEARLTEARTEKFLELSEEEIRTMVHRAIAFANVDVKDFALDDPGVFLSNTWKLLPESNVPLRNRSGFSIHEYRVALGNMLNFFLSLNPAQIYHSYQGTPDDAEMSRLESKARLNLLCSETYLKAKLLAVGLLEAIAEVTGGDAPLALFMGDLSHDGTDHESLMQHLEIREDTAWLDGGNAVYRLLKDGRLDESSFDLRNSPLALYLYTRIKPAAWGKLTKDAEAYFSHGITAEAFIDCFESSILKEVLAACAYMVPTRQSLFQKRIALG